MRVRHIRCIFRWVRWVFGHPNPARLILSGVDQESRRVIYRRWDEREPKCDCGAKERGQS